MENLSPEAVPVEILQKEGFDPAQSCGLFVGVSSFEDPRLAPVPFAVDDATDLAHLFVLELGLISPARTVLSLAGEPKKPETLDRLGRLVEAGVRRVSARQRDLYRYLGEQAREAGPRGLLLISAATHGVSDPGGDYLVATDSLAERTLRTGLAMDDLFDEVARAGSPRRLVLLDACRERLNEGTRGLADAAMAKTFADALMRAVGQVVLSGASEGGFAYDDSGRGNGVFTAAVLDGLRGAAPVDERGLITTRTLADFLQQRVISWVRRNRPEHAARSLGIGQRFEGPAGTLPLAIDPKRSEAAEIYRGRRIAALARLRENLGSVLKGTDYDLVEGLLPAEERQPGAERLLGELETLNGTVLSQRGFWFFLHELAEPAVPGESAPPGSAPQPLISAAGRSPKGWLRGRLSNQRTGLGIAIFLGLLVALGMAWLVSLAFRAGEVDEGEWPKEGQAAFLRGDYAVAADRYDDGCKAGNLRSCAELGRFFQGGVGGLPQDPAKAVELYRKACNGSEQRGCVYLGVAQCDAIGGLLRDKHSANQLFRRACDKGELRGCSALSFSLFLGDGGLPKDSAQAVALLKRACGGGEMMGCTSLAFSYRFGTDGLPKDGARAAALLKKACGGGEMLACVHLATMYSNGEGGLVADTAQAVALYKRSCEGGNARGCRHLGRAYDRGEGGLTRDAAQAAALYLKSCEGGEADACGSLGVSYYQGEGGIPGDPSRAAALFKRACDGGSLFSCSNLGMLYERGEGGLSQDPIQAVSLYQKACDGKALNGCYNLGLMYENGTGGLPKDRARAIALYKMACEGAIAAGCENVKRLSDPGSS